MCISSLFLLTLCISSLCFSPPVGYVRVPILHNQVRNSSQYISPCHGAWSLALSDLIMQPRSVCISSRWLCALCSGALWCPPWTHTARYTPCLYASTIQREMLIRNGVWFEGKTTVLWKPEVLASEFCMIFSCAKVTIWKGRNWARSMKGSGQEFGFSRCRVQEGIWSTESMHFDQEFEFPSRTPVSLAIFLDISKVFSRFSRGIERPFMMMFES